MHQGDFLRARSTVCFLSNQSLFQKKAIQNFLFLLLVTLVAPGLVSYGHKWSHAHNSGLHKCHQGFLECSTELMKDLFQLSPPLLPRYPSSPPGMVSATVLLGAWPKHRYQTRSFTGVLINFWLMVVVLVSSLTALPFILESVLVCMIKYMFYLSLMHSFYKGPRQGGLCESIREASKQCILYPQTLIEWPGNPFT